MSIFNLEKDKVRYALVSVYSLEKKSTIPFKHLVTLVDVTKEKESERVKTDFLLLASHQLRTPLTTVKWYIDYLLTTNKAEMSDVVREYLEQIYIGNERMIELITTLLTVSRIEMGTLAPDYKTIKINEVVDDILEELAQDIKKKNTKIEVKSEGNDSLVMDYTMIRIVIHNLLTNAIKYTPSGGKVLVNLNFQPHSCEISVSDTGYGIPKEEQDKIFTKMFRASNARKVSTSGTGLGLYLSKAFVEKLGGAIDFTSEEGKGTTFTISLPRVAPGA
jgi:signal transduction histidine kinase